MEEDRTGSLKPVFGSSLILLVPKSRQPPQPETQRHLKWKCLKIKLTFRVWFGMFRALTSYSPQPPVPTQSVLVFCFPHYLLFAGQVPPFLLKSYLGTRQVSPTGPASHTKAAPPCVNSIHLDQIL